MTRFIPFPNRKRLDARNRALRNGFELMNNDTIYRRCQAAGWLEAVLSLATIAGAVTAVFVFFKYGLLASLATFLLCIVLFALARLFELAADLLSMVGRIEEAIKAGRKSATDDTVVRK